LSAAAIRREARAALLWGGILFLLSLVPYLVAQWNAPPGHEFNGFFYIADDATTYVAKMREGMEGAWGWTDRYITSPQPQPVALFLFYIIFGKVAGLLHIPLYAGYHLARLSGAIVLVLGARALTRACLPEGRARLAALVLALLGSGLAIAVQLLIAFIPDTSLLGQKVEALDLHLPELAGFYSILAIPHFAWAAALLAFAVVGLMGIARATSASASAWPVVWTTLVLLALCVIHPQMLFVLAPLAAAYLLLVRGGPSRWLWTALPFLVCAGPVAYYFRVLTADPVIEQWSRQWKHQAPGIISLLLALGIPLGLALLAVLRGWWRQSPELTLMGIWVGFVIALLYIPNPVNIQRRLLDGIYLPVAVLAGLAVARLRRTAAFALVAVSAVSTAFVFGISLNWGLTRQPFIYLTSGETEAMAWLAGHQGGHPPAAVLSDPDTGLYIPARSGDPVYAGHYSETVDFRARALRARDEIRAGGAALLGFMRHESITYLFFGPTERSLGGPDPSGLNSLLAVYDRDGVVIYRLT